MTLISIAYRCLSIHVCIYSATNSILCWFTITKTPPWNVFLKFHAFTQTFNEQIKPSFLLFFWVAVHFFPVLIPELFSGCQLLWLHTWKCVSIYINYIIMVNPNFCFIIQWYCFASPMTPDFREFALVQKGTHYKSMVKFRKGRRLHLLVIHNIAKC